jgi:cell division protein FtsQ
MSVDAGAAARRGLLFRAHRSTSKLAVGRQTGLGPGAAAAALVLIALLGMAAVLATGGRGRAIAAFVQAAGESRLATLGLKVSSVRVKGGSPLSDRAILAAAQIKPGAPILAVDLAAARARVENVAWVDHARVGRLLPDTILIDVDQRPMMALWQHAGRQVVVANDGRPMPRADAARFAALPLLVGEGANTAAPAFLPLIKSHPRLWSQVSALVRVDERRWTVILKDGGAVLLPSLNEAGALDRLEALDRDGRILSLHLARLDLRDPETVVARPREVQAAAPSATNAPAIPPITPAGTPTATTKTGGAR